MRGGKIIIRCDTDHSIVALASILEEKGESFVSIHENFPDRADCQRRRVPVAADEDAKIWIHQYKLLEGIDDPAFRFLAAYEFCKPNVKVPQCP